MPGPVGPVIWTWGMSSWASLKAPKGSVMLTFWYPPSISIEQPSLKA